VSLGQARLLWDREEIDESLIARLPERERDGLASVERALAKADQLGLGSSGSYRHLIDRDGAPLVTLVIAAPPDRVEATRWWFPIVGHVPYLGYFDPERARRSAERLALQGLDTFVRPALLYSTLGWFDDPLPRGLLRRDRIDIFDILVHERVHESIFVAGDLAYNESLATFIAERATLELVADDAAALARARERFLDRRRFADLIDRLARELDALYRTTDGPEAARRTRQAVFERFQGEEFERLDWQTPLYRGFAQAELSNAYVVAHQTYFGDLPCLERELLELGGDIGELVRRHRDAPGRRLDPDRDCAPLADE
jgi:predicted aminopeptidase